MPVSVVICAVDPLVTICQSRRGLETQTCSVRKLRWVSGGGWEHLSHTWLQLMIPMPSSVVAVIIGDAVALAAICTNQG